MKLSKTSIKHTQKKAFTLAEVLITIGIIGIVAALTIPVLMNKTQNAEFETGFKKSYSTVTQALQMIMTDENVSEIGQTSLFDGSAFSNAARQTQIDTTMQKHFRITKVCKYGDATCIVNNITQLGNSTEFSFFASDSYNFTLADGSRFKMQLGTTCDNEAGKTGQMKANCGNIWVDINGAKKPNKYGRDFFLFWVSPDGIHPHAGTAYAIYMCGVTAGCTNYYWKERPQICGTSGSSAIASDTIGHGCAGRIVEEGFKMNY